MHLGDVVESRCNSSIQTCKRLPADSCRMQAATGDRANDYAGHCETESPNSNTPFSLSTSSKQETLKNLSSLSEDDDLHSQVEKMRGYLDYYCDQVNLLKQMVESRDSTAAQTEAEAKEHRRQEKLRKLKTTSKAIASANNWWARSHAIRIPYRMHSKFDNQVGASHQSIVQDSLFHNKVAPDQQNIAEEEYENKEREKAEREKEREKKREREKERKNQSENPSESQKDEGNLNIGHSIEDDEANPSVSWVTVSQNAYGAFLHVGLQTGYVRAVFLCGTMLIVSICIQIVFSVQLFLIHLPDLENADVITQICEIPSSLQICGVMIFITLVGC